MEINKLKEILKGCQKNDRLAQKQLYKAFYRHGLSVCLRYVSNMEDAQELVDDSFVKAFNQFHTYKNDFPFVSWFQKILVNTCIDFNRKSFKMAENSNLDVIENIGFEPDVFEEFSVQALMDLIQKLSPAYRLVFNLFAIDGYSHKEIATMLNISEGTSFSNLARAKKKLQTMIQQN